jgi:hypothetical protein
MAEHTHLSEEGRARRDAIRAELAACVPHEAARRRRRRTATRAAGVAAVLALAAGAWWWGSRPGAPLPAPTPSGPIAEGPAPPKPRIEIIRVGAEPGITERYAVDPAVRAERIDDEELLGLLAEKGTPIGLVRTPQGVYLTSELEEDGRSADRESGA